MKEEKRNNIEPSQTQRTKVLTFESNEHTLGEEKYRKIKRTREVKRFLTETIPSHLFPYLELTLSLR
jgi:hypothetical protein